MKLKLSVLARVKMINLFDTVPGSKRDSRIDGRISERLDLSKEERESCDFTMSVAPHTEQVHYRWNPSSDFTAEIEFSPEEIARMKLVFDTWNGYNRLERIAWIDGVLEQLGIQN